MIVIAAFAAALALSPAARADMPPAPTAAALQSQLSLTLPPYWKITQLTIEASANYGNAVEPSYKQRVVAIIEPTDDLYVPAGKLDNVDLLAQSMKASDTRKLYLIATSNLRADTWQSTFERQNDPTNGAGKPRGFYTGATMVQGSPEEQAYQKQQAADAATRQQQQLAAIAQQQALAAATAKGQMEKTQQASALEAAKDKTAEEEATGRHAAFEDSLKAIEANATGLLKADLPAYWQIKTFTLTTPADVTEATTLAPQAVVQQHFAATVVLTADTFVAEKSGALVRLQPALKAGAARDLNGVVESVRGPEGWRSKLAIHGAADSADGQPRSYYPGTAIVQGSPEDQAYQKQQATDAAARQQQQLAAVAQTQALAAATAKGQLEKTQEAAALQAAKVKAAEDEAAGRHAAFEASLNAIETNATNLLRAKLPSYWQIKSLTLTPAGDVTEQATLAPQAVVRQRLMATVTLGEDIFAASTPGDGTTTILQPAHKAGEVVNIDGTLQSVPAPEGWRSTLALSNKLPAAADGEPRSYYSGTVIMAGSPEEAAYRKHEAAILQAGAIPAGKYKVPAGSCAVHNVPLPDGRVQSIFSCDITYNPVLSIMSGPANKDHPLYGRFTKLGLRQHATDYAWGQITGGRIGECNRWYLDGTLVGTQVSGPSVTFALFAKGVPECEFTTVRTGS